MEQIIQYISHWNDNTENDKRVQMLIDTYNIVSKDARLKDWRFAPGRNRPDGFCKEPMHCAFAATPFIGNNDWFILRLVKEPSNYFAIGFCPYYGVQDNKQQPSQDVTNRRKEIRKAIKKIEENQPELLHGVTFPQSAPRPHAFKGFEEEFIMPSDAEQLANKFIITVLEWEKLFKLII